MPVNPNQLDPVVAAQFKETLTASQNPVLQDELRRRSNAALGAALNLAVDPRNAPANYTPPPEEADGLWESFQAGFEISTTGLILSQESPDTILDNDASRAERLSFMAAMVIGDLPTLVVGGLSGGVVGAPTGPAALAVAGAGAFGLTEGTRTWLLEQYETGASKADLADRLTATAFATAKGAVIGGATGGVGGKVAQFAKGAKPVRITGPATPASGSFAKTTANSAMTPRIESGLGQFGAITSSELVTMVSVSHALEGELPNADSFLDAAIVLGGLKGAVGVSGKLRTIYTRTGRKPEEVLQEAHKDSKVYQELIDERFPAIPEKFRAEERSPLRPAVREAPKEVTGAEPVGSPRVEASRLRKPNEAHKIPDHRLDLKDGPRKVMNELVDKYEAEFKQAQRGRVSLERTDQEAMAFIREALGEKTLENIAEPPGTARHAAKMRAIDELTTITLNEVTRREITITRKQEAGAKPTSEELAEFVLATERFKHLALTLRGESSEIARAMRSMRDATRIKEAATREKEITKLLESVGGRAEAEALAKVFSGIKDPANKGKPLRQPTRFDMLVEGWKAMLLSGPSTQQVNFFGTGFFSATRVPKALVAATFSKFRPGTPERVAYTDAIALTSGMVEGAWSAVRAAGESMRLEIEGSQSFAQGIWNSYKKIGLSEKAEQGFNAKIPGAIGHMIRGPFKLLNLSDIMFRTANSRGTIMEMSSRQALEEGFTPLSKSYWNRVRELSRNPTEETVVKSEADALRYVFLEEGPIIKALSNLRNDIPVLQFVIPFLKAPGGIVREFVRMTPMAPIIKQFRADFKKGGAARDRALAEVSMGLSIGIVVFSLARDGVITGGGHPDDRQRRADFNKGFQPYSIKLKDGTQITYDRWEPMGTLLGMAADMATAWDLMNEGETEQAASALMWASTEVIKNKTWLRGLTTAINAITDPERYGANWVEQLAGTAVPGLVGQVAREMDPHVREIDSILSSVQSRIPGLREQLPVVYDDFGEPVQRSRGVFPFSPSTQRQLSDDPVRIEAARLGVSTSGAPRQLQAGSVLGEEARVDLTDEQRDIFATESGQLAHQIMSQAVNSPGWPNIPKLAQRRFFERAFMMARQQGAIAALPPEQRAAAIREIRDEFGL